jgi:hypothetical protein
LLPLQTLSGLLTLMRSYPLGTEACHLFHEQVETAAGTLVFTLAEMVLCKASVNTGRRQTSDVKWLERMPDGQFRR